MVRRAVTASLQINPTRRRRAAPGAGASDVARHARRQATGLRPTACRRTESEAHPFAGVGGSPGLRIPAWYLPGSSARRVHRAACRWTCPAGCPIQSPAPGLPGHGQRRRDKAARAVGERATHGVDVGVVILVQLRREPGVLDRRQDEAGQLSKCGSSRLAIGVSNSFALSQTCLARNSWPITPTCYSTVTLFARFLGLSTSVPRAHAV